MNGAIVQPSMVRDTVVALVALAAVACGGRTSPDEDGGTLSGSSSSMTGSLGGGSSQGGSSQSGSSVGGGPGSGSGPSSSPGSPAGAGSSQSGQGTGGRPQTRDAGAPPTDSAPPPSGPCTMGAGGGSGSGGPGAPPTCEIMAQETCGADSYQVSCACPQGTCACFGATTNVVSFTGCPVCPNISAAFALCGFPH